MSYCLRNTSAKNYRNQIMIVCEIYSKSRVRRFLRRSVYIAVVVVVAAAAAVYDFTQ